MRAGGSGATGRVPAAGRCTVPGEQSRTMGAMRTALNGMWPRTAALVLVIGVGVLLAVTVGVPSVDAVRAAVDAAGGAGWGVLVVGTALLLLAPVPRSALSVVAGVVLGFGGGLAVAYAGGMLGAVGAFAL